MTSVVRRIHFAYRSSGDDFLGGHDTYSVAVREGAISVRPVVPGRRPSRATPTPVKPREGAPLALQTVALGRGTDALALPAAKATTGKDGALAIPRGLATELIRNTAEGVEQSWRFDNKPPRSGDLVVRVRAEGLQPRPSTREGLHFFDPHTGLGLRYGHGTWVDAAGRRSPVLARAEGRDIVLTVPAALVDGSSYPAVLDPVIGPEIGSDQPITVGPADGHQTTPAIAFGGGMYLAVWNDSRGAVQTVAATRIAQDGTVLDPTGFYVNLTSGSYPGVAFGGGHFFVVWLGYRDDTFNSYGIMGSRVSTAGTVLDPQGLALTSTVGDNRASIAFDGTNFLLVWDQWGHESPNFQVLASRLTTAGVPIDATPIVLATDNLGLQSPTVTFCGTSYVAAWQRTFEDDDPYAPYQEDLYVGRVGVNGTALDPGGIVLSNAHRDQSAPRAACVGTTALVVWEDSREAYTDPSGGSWNIMGARFANGTVLDTGGLYIGVATLNQRHPAIASSGTNFLVAWSDGRNYLEDDIYATRVSASGFVLDADGFKVGNLDKSQTSPALASDGTDFLGVWENTNVNIYTPSGYWYPSDIVGARISGAGAVLDPTPALISHSGQPQRYPRVGSNGSEYLLVWEEVRGADYDLYASRVSADGELLDPLGIDLGTGAGYDNVSDITSDGTNFFVLWTKSSNADADVLLTRISAEGTILDPTPIVVSNETGYQLSPRAIFDGTNVFVAWLDERDGTDTDHIYGARISPAGEVLDRAGIPILTTTVRRWGPALARSATQTLLTWSELVNNQYRMRAVRLSAAGAPLDAAPIVVSNGDADDSDGLASAASDGAGFLVAWKQGTNSPFAQIRGARISPAGNVLDPAGILIGPAPNGQFGLSATFTGGRYLVVWEDMRHAGSTTQDIMGNYVTPCTGAAGASEFVVSAEAGTEMTPVLAAGAPGRALVAYMHFVPDSGVATERIRARLITDEVDSTCSGCESGCDDGNPCTADSCSASTCQHAPVAPGTSCSDSNVCNGAETCDGAGLCQAGTALDCNDQDGCTTDTCDSVSGCQHAATSAPQCGAVTVVSTNKAARQSSTYVTAVAARAVDGNTNGDYYGASVSHTNWEAAPWWEVDLGGSYAVSQVKLYNRTDCCDDRLQNFYVFLSAQPFSSTDPIVTAGQPGVVSIFVSGAAGALHDVALSGVGRYVRVQLTQPNYLQLAEVEVLGTPADVPPEATNVAAGKPATQSSTFTSAALAVDGNTNGDFAAGSVTHTHSDPAPWWEVDLGAQYAVSQVKLFNRTDCCEDRLQNFYVFLSAQPFSSTDPAVTALQPGVVSTFVSGAAGAVHDVALSGVGRYVRVQLTQLGYLSLAEVQVMGMPGGAPPEATNVAAGKPATQSSTFTSAALAVDGNTNGDFAAGSVTHTHSDPAPWWEVDLGAQYAVSQVKLFNRTDCCEDRLQNFYVFLSAQPFSSTDPAVTALQPGVVSTFVSGAVGAVHEVALSGVGRYVRVQVTQLGYLSLAEVQVMGTSGATPPPPMTSAPINVAPGKAATQSSTFASAAFAVDGNANGDFGAGSVTHTHFDSAPWWQLDLGAQYSVSQVSLYNRTDCCGERLQDFYVFLSPEPFSSTDPQETAAQPGVISVFVGAASGDVPARYDLPLVGAGRYVRVQLVNPGYLSLAEVKVFVNH